MDPFATAGPASSSSGLAGRSDQANLLDLPDGFDLDDVKEAAQQIVQESVRKRPKITHDKLFDDEFGFKKVLRDFPKIDFRGKGREFDDLKVLLAHTERWFKDLYPQYANEHIEDNLSKVRQTLSEREKADDGLTSDPHDRLCKMRIDYKAADGGGLAAARQKAKEAAAAKAAMKSGKALPDDVRKRIEANKLAALAKKLQREGGAATSTGVLSPEEEKRMRIEANRQRALEKKQEKAVAAELAAQEAAFMEAEVEEFSQAPAFAGFDEEEDIFGLGFGLDDEDVFERGSIPTPMQQPPPSQKKVAPPPEMFEEEEDPFGHGSGGLDDDF